MTVQVSTMITDPQCVEQALQRVAAWQPQLGALAGLFEIQHGANQPCGAVHEEPFDGGFWIVAMPRGCNVFVTEDGHPNDYVGAGNLVAYVGGCQCGAGH
jgi:hypothetical protein